MDFGFLTYLGVAFLIVAGILYISWRKVSSRPQALERISLVVGVLGVLVGVAGVIGDYRERQTAGQPSPEPTRSTSAGASLPGATPTNTTSAGPGTAAPLWGPSTFVLEGSRNLDLDTSPPTVDSAGVDADMSWYLDARGPWFVGTASSGPVTAAVPEGTTVTAGVCRDLTSREAASEVRARVGATICVVTGRDAVAALKPVSIDEEAQRMKLEVVVWA